MANIAAPMIARATTTAPMTIQLRVRSLRFCSAISAWARSDFDCFFGFFATGEPFVRGEQQVVEGKLGAWPDDQPHRAQEQADVAGDVQRVLAMRVRGDAAVAEAAAVDLQPS